MRAIWRLPSHLLTIKKSEKSLTRIVILCLALGSMMSDYEVHLTDETKTNDLDVKFHGPKDSACSSLCLLDRK